MDEEGRETSEERVEVESPRGGREEEEEGGVVRLT